ncbi:MAG: sigma-70 family RNA polymerase sigma factor [Acidobacteriota bacterium]|nr:sigma-70 family RNA polymerase sigma factor [Acidobacteriota bacterium]
MSRSAPQNLTQLLLDWGGGDQAALDRLTPVVYQELRRLARRHMRREREGHTLQTTALVHEAYLRLVNQKTARWQNRAQFFAVAARLMRRILIDHARGQSYAKRGGGARKVPLDEVAAVTPARAADLVALDEALKSLAQVDDRKAQVVEMKYFGGLTTEEIAEVLGVSTVTVLRDWSIAKAWLLREMSDAG